MILCSIVKVEHAFFKLVQPSTTLIVALKSVLDLKVGRVTASGGFCN